AHVVLVLIVREAEDAEVLLGLAEHVERAAEPLGDGARLGSRFFCRAATTPRLLRSHKIVACRRRLEAGRDLVEARGLAHDAERHPDVNAADRLGGRAEAAGLEVLLVRVDGRRDDLDAFLEAADVVDGAARELAGAEPVLNFYGVVARIDALDGWSAPWGAKDLERSCLCERQQQECVAPSHGIDRKVALLARPHE
ncbi:unnamed protein product, partial [Pelagomonas calceolata]